MNHRAVKWVALGGVALVVLTGLTVFTAALTRTLQSIDRHEARLVVLQRQANAGLTELKPKIARLKSIRTQSQAVAKTLGGVSADLDGTNVAVAKLDRRLGTIAVRLIGVSTGVTGLGGRVGGISTKLGGLTGSLSSTAGNVAALTGDVNGIASELHGFPDDLLATNDRLRYINAVVGRLGHRGVTTRIGINVSLGASPVGTAEITAVLIPTGAWSRP